MENLVRYCSRAGKYSKALFLWRDVIFFLARKFDRPNNSGTFLEFMKLRETGGSKEGGGKTLYSALQQEHLRILAVDDEESTVLLYENIFLFEQKSALRTSDRSFEFAICRQGPEAVDVVKQALKDEIPFALVFLDVQMPPGPDGIWAAERIRAIDPQIEIVLVSANTELDLKEIAQKVPPVHKLLFLQKPFHAREIVQFISALGAKWHAECELRAIYEDMEKRIEERTHELNILNEELQEDIRRRQEIENRLLQLEQAVEFMQIGVLISDLDGCIRYINTAGAAMHAFQQEELEGRNMNIFTPPELKKPLSLSQVGDWQGLVRESVHLRKDGSTFPVWLMSEIVMDSQGEPYALVISCEDISERKRAEEALRKSEERYRVVLESAPDPVVVYDMEATVIYFNPAFTRVFGWTLEESFGRELQFVPVESHRDNRLFSERIKRGEVVSGFESLRVAKDGKKVDVVLSGAGFFDADGSPQGCIVTLQDITMRKQRERDIKFLAYHDTLTGLQNRKSFYMRLEDELKRSYRRGADERRLRGAKWALLFLDLDNFKQINDSLGHNVGDTLLKSAAFRIEQCLRKSDQVFRFGGDEFTVILNNLAHDTDVAKVAQKIRKEVSKAYNIGGNELHATVSVGISIYPDDGEQLETLVKNADLALYSAKESREGYRFFTEEMNQMALERLTLENSLRHALEEQQFRVYYQPLVNNRRQLVGMEALIRWQHPERGLIGPAKFIPIAEETGDIVSIGEWVLTEASRRTKQWHEMGYSDLTVAVNLSPRQFKEAGLIDMVTRALDESGLPPEFLKLEVTESGIMEKPEEAIEKMESLRKLGVRFALDDFGTGYSSLSYLKRFPIKTLKIDRSFVIDCTHDKGDQEIIKTIIAMARNLEMDTVAEGVETLGQQKFLTEHGAHVLQGYYYGKPMPDRGFEDLLKDRSMTLP